MGYGSLIGACMFLYASWIGCKKALRRKRDRASSGSWPHVPYLDVLWSEERQSFPMVLYALVHWPLHLLWCSCLYAGC